MSAELERQGAGSSRPDLAWVQRLKKQDEEEHSPIEDQSE
jgi:hypothetical protein